MNDDQIKLARHALGLTRHKKSCRNYFVISNGSRNYTAWVQMVSKGWAWQSSGLAGCNDCFHMTEDGAKLVLKRGESLCPEDFPVKVDTSE